MRPYDGSGFVGVDRHLEREPRRESGGRVRYRCLDCDYRPPNGLTAYRHHVGHRPHHRIALVTGGLSVFSCCKGVSK